MNVFAAIGRVFLAFLAQTGRLTLFTIDSVTSIVRPPVYGMLIGQQMLRIGYFSSRPVTLAIDPARPAASSLRWLPGSRGRSGSPSSPSAGT